jgi:hypothetical protein
MASFRPPSHRQHFKTQALSGHHLMLSYCNLTDYEKPKTPAMGLSNIVMMGAPPPLPQSADLQQFLDSDVTT